MPEPKTNFPLNVGAYSSCIFIRGYDDKCRLGGCAHGDALSKEYGVKHLTINNDTTCTLHFDTEEHRTRYTMVYL